MIRIPPNKPGSKIDTDRYIETCKAAITEIAPVLDEAARNAPHVPETDPRADLGYRDFFNVVTELPDTRFGAYPIRLLIIKLAAAKGYEVRFTRLDRGKEESLKGFVSWLWVNEGAKLLEIIYDPDKIKKFVEVDKCREIRPKQYFWADMILSKVFLHEYGHASRHLQIVLRKMGSSGAPAKLDIEHEQDAWLYTETIWGILLGDHASFSRLTAFGTDEAWKFA